MDGNAMGRKAARNETIAALQESMSNNPNLSISRSSHELNLSSTSTWRILPKNLALHPYKIQLTQELRLNNNFLRRRFADEVTKLIFES